MENAETAGAWEDRIKIGKPDRKWDPVKSAISFVDFYVAPVRFAHGKKTRIFNNVPAFLWF